jgi:hypothetical protein
MLYGEKNNCFSRVRKITKSYSYLLDVCLSVRMQQQLGSHQTDFFEIWYLIIFWKSINKLTFDKNPPRRTGT